MGHRDEPKMDELKKLLRRLDGLDGDRGLAKKGQQAEAEQRGWVGALRGTPALAGVDSLPVPAPGARSRSVGPAILAAATAAIISTVTMYMVMSQAPLQGNRAVTPQPAGSVTPGKLDMREPAPSGTAKQQSTDSADGLVRRADMLLGSGELEAARTLLQRAAELGSGNAALRLGRSYDPSQARLFNFADSQSNPALAKAWYERALALGTQEAAAYLSQPDGK